MKSKQDIIKKIEQILPQTQCRRCGFADCASYAKALAYRTTQANLCTVGGDKTAQQIAEIADLPVYQGVQSVPLFIARIEEDGCIGCTACIAACPVNAVSGAAKLMHAVIADECTGCGLCLEVCPTDCIQPVEVKDNFLPRNTFLSNNPEPKQAAKEHAKWRYQQKQSMSLPEKTLTQVPFDISQLVNRAAQCSKKRISIRSDELIKQALQQQQYQATLRNQRRQEQYGLSNVDTTEK